MAPARPPRPPATGLEARLQSRTNTWDAPTSGIAPGHLQANLLVLPSRFARDFELLCARNPVPCPLLAKSSRPGDYRSWTSCQPDIIPASTLAADLDIRTDAARYNIYSRGQLQRHGAPDVVDYWAPDHVAFLIGCSYSFESALAAAGLTPPHVVHGRNVAMYRSALALCPAGVFREASWVVSMRMYRASEVEPVRDVTRPYVATHGEPIAWGWDGAERLGIRDVNVVDWGDVPLTAEGDVVDRVAEEARPDGYVPVFWGCGVTPQEAVMKAEIPGVTIGHTPGYMVVLDVKEEDVLWPRDR